MQIHWTAPNRKCPAVVREPLIAIFGGGDFWILRRVIETQINERGGNPIYKPGGHSSVLAFWEPLAECGGITSPHRPKLSAGTLNLPIMGYNSFAKPAIWESFFNATKNDNFGLEWDPSHLICQFIDPVQSIQRFGARIFHVHAKDAYIDRSLLELRRLPGWRVRTPRAGQVNELAARARAESAPVTTRI
jgi:sugar phosphate isomerase/epimerase